MSLYPSPNKRITFLLFQIVISLEFYMTSADTFIVCGSYRRIDKVNKNEWKVLWLSFPWLQQFNNDIELYLLEFQLICTRV